MMHCEKLLSLKITRIIFLFSILFFTNCSKETKKEDYIARVNKTYLTREEFTSLVDTTNLTGIEKEQIIKSWIYRELLFQKAKEEGIVDQDDYKNVLKKSSQELAAAMLLNNYVSSEEIELSDSELLEYYERNKNSFQLSSDSYLINKISFNTEDKAITFRSLAIESDWVKAANVFGDDTSMLRSINAELIEEKNLYPYQLMKIAKDIYPQEISIVITENAQYYSIVQILGKFPKGSIPKFEIIRQKIETRLLAEKKKQLIDYYLKELYSNNDIEIKK